MATFDVKVVKIQKIEEHGNADALEIATIHGFRSVVKKNQYRAGDLAVYIPEAALIPEYLLKRLGMWDNEKSKGRLNGPDGNRVKAIRLRGVVSQGILLELELNSFGNTRYAVTNGEGDLLSVLEGIDVKDALGIKKWEPEIPPAMAGEVTNIGQVFPGYDVENFQRFPHIFEEDEHVVATEKLHGTCSIMVNQPGANNSLFVGGEWTATSKGVGKNGLVMVDRESNARNIYLRSLKRLLDEGMNARLAVLRERGVYGLTTTNQLVIYGETFGKGVQDLTYGQTNIAFRGFDVFVGDRNTGRWMNTVEKMAFFAELGIDMVPILYEGPFDVSALEAVRDGNTTMTEQKQIREGIVVTPKYEREHPEIGRVLLKMVSPDYLLRKGNSTEFQ